MSHVFGTDMPGGQWADRNAVQSQFVDQAWAYCHRIRKPQIWPTQDKLTPLQQQLWPLPDSSESAAAFAMLHMLHKYPSWKQPENSCGALFAACERSMCPLSPHLQGSFDFTFKWVYF